MRGSILLGLAATGLVLVPTVPAAHGCHPTTSAAVLTLGSADRYSATVYVAIDAPAPDDLFIPLPWIYAESNGISGLQRDDDWRDDTCGGAVRGDALVF